MRVWRICSERHAARAFSGEGAQLTSGRWNSEGVPMAYSSEHLSLAALELLVHVIQRNEPQDLIAVEAELPSGAEAVGEQKISMHKKLPEDWRHDLSFTQALGDAWIAAGESFFLYVPSVLIDVEWNILINPQHKAFATMRIVQQRPFRYDARMFQAQA